MTKDFAKKRSYKKKKKTFFNKMLIIILISLMLFLSGAFFYYYNLFKKKVSLISENNRYPYHSKTVSAVEKVEVKPRFEFYNILSNQKEENKKATKSSFKKGSSSNFNSDEKGIYILQIAAFRHIGEAKRLMVEITNKGFQVGLKKDIEQKWIRVQVGPYSSKNLAEKAQRNLKNLNYNSILVKIG